MSEPDIDFPRGPFEEAAAWFARMRGPDAEANRGQFEAWLAGDARNRRAYSRAAEIFAMGKLLQDDERQGGKPASPSRRRRAPVAATVAAAALVAGSAGWIGLRHMHPVGNNAGAPAISSEGSRPLELANDTSGARQYRLSDGSLITAASATRISVDLGPRIRRIVLTSGEARFSVAHETRPFVVYAGGGTVTARGTLFDVALSPDRRVRVRLIEGVIDVASPPGTQRSRPLRLIAGQSTSFEARTSLPAIARSVPPPAAPDASAAVLDYDAVRLSELVDDANRRSQRPIRTAGALGERRVSGRFRIDDTELLADRLAALFDLTVDRSKATAILLRPPARRNISAQTP
jgi:transmembrane sensor